MKWADLTYISVVVGIVAPRTFILVDALILRGKVVLVGAGSAESQGEAFGAVEGAVLACICHVLVIEPLNACTMAEAVRSEVEAYPT